MQFIDDERIPAQPYPELRMVLRKFVDGVSALLTENIVGIYLVGSLATGDFDLDSDIDFLVVMGDDPDAVQLDALQTAQKEIYTLDCYPAKHLEGSFICLHDLNDAACVGKKPLPYFDNGSTRLEFATHDNNWHVRWVLRERGITLLGQCPQQIVNPIPPDALKQEIKTLMVQRLMDFSEAQSAPLCFENSRFGWSFFILTYCRMLHTLASDGVYSKKAGAAWAKQVVAPEWVDLIAQAWEERQGVRFGEKIGQQADAALLVKTHAFMQYAVAQIAKFD